MQSTSLKALQSSYMSLPTARLSEACIYPGRSPTTTLPPKPLTSPQNSSDGALNGTVTFTIPDKTFGGNTLEGDIKYLVRANGSLFAQGTASPGTKIEADGKVDEDGAYEIELELTNAAGRGPKSKISQWIGHDTPVSFSSANLHIRQRSVYPDMGSPDIYGTWRLHEPCDALV